METDVVLFLDESGQQTNAVWSGGIVVPRSHVEGLESSLEEAVRTFRSANYLRGTPEIHATNFISGKAPWKVELASTEAMAHLWIDVLRSAGVQYVFRGINSTRAGGWQRWGTKQQTAFEIAFGHLVSAVDSKLNERGLRCRNIVHDETSLSHKLAEHLQRACLSGVTGTPRRPCNSTDPNIEFRDSRRSRILQAADLALWIQQRRWVDAGSGPRGHWATNPEKRKSRVAKRLAEEIQSNVLVRHCWTPT